MGWEAAGQAWGRHAWDWALLQEQANANSFDLLQQLTGVDAGVRLLDLACGSGLALQRAQARGDVCFGIDASEGLLAVAAERAPGASLTHGDTADLPYDDGSFDVVTCVNGVQYGSGQALEEVARVLRPGGRFAMAFWRNTRPTRGQRIHLRFSAGAARSACEPGRDCARPSHTRPWSRLRTATATGSGTPWCRKPSTTSCCQASAVSCMPPSRRA